jgi:hypothetical protein
MAGPVWRFDQSREGFCDSCLRRREGLFVEGEVAGNELHPVRLVCSECISGMGPFVIAGEVDGRVPGPAYAHNNQPLEP